VCLRVQGYCEGYQCLRVQGYCEGYQCLRVQGYCEGNNCVFGYTNGMRDVCSHRPTCSARLCDAPHINRHNCSSPPLSTINIVPSL
jgi:hypothetical protein